MADPDQPRTEFVEEDIAQLSKSIQEKGQLHPIHVRWSEDRQKWIIISGERRFRATKLAGLPTINCQFEEQDLGKTEILEQQLIENLQQVGHCIEHREGTEFPSEKILFWAVLENESATRIIRELMLGSNRRAMRLLEELAVSIGSKLNQ